MKGLVGSQFENGDPHRLAEAVNHPSQKARVTRTVIQVLPILSGHPYIPRFSVSEPEFTLILFNCLCEWLCFSPMSV